MISRIINIVFIGFVCLSVRAQLPSKLEFRVYDMVSSKAITPTDSCFRVSVMLFDRNDQKEMSGVEYTLIADYTLQQKYKDGYLVDSSIVEKGHFIFQESKSIQDLTTRKSYVASWMASRDLLIVIRKECPTVRKQMMQVFVPNIEGSVDLGVIDFCEGVHQTPEIVQYINEHSTELERDLIDGDILFSTDKILYSIDTNFHPTIQIPGSVKFDVYDNSLGKAIDPSNSDYELSITYYKNSEELIPTRSYSILPEGAKITEFKNGTPINNSLLFSNSPYEFISFTNPYDLTTYRRYATYWSGSKSMSITIRRKTSEKKNDEMKIFLINARGNLDLGRVHFKPGVYEIPIELIKKSNCIDFEKDWGSNIVIPLEKMKLFKK